MARIYIVATPIGNLNDITQRALDTLGSADIIACEDTRNTLKLLTHFNISKTLISCHEHNEFNVFHHIINLVKEGKKVAMVSDAGYPGISDPGSILIRNCIEEDIDVEVVSGPCAIINALVGSGLDTTHFYFHGFLPSKSSDRKKELATIKDKSETMIFYEAPHRINDTLNEMLAILGDRYACVCRELTKKHEEYVRGMLSELAIKEYKGELVVVVSGKQKEEVIITSAEIIQQVNELIKTGLSTKDAIKETADILKVKKNEVYKVYFQ